MSASDILINMSITLEEVADALRYVDCDDRDTWILMGICVKEEFYDDGFEIWDDWSRSSPSYKENDARLAWRSFKPGRGAGIGTLIFTARQYGWNGGISKIDYDELERRKEANRKKREKMEKLRKQDAGFAKDLAAIILENTIVRRHSYLIRKGFPRAKGNVLRMSKFDELVAVGPYPDLPFLADLCFPDYTDVIYEEALVVPMRSESGELLNVQLIGEFGDKKFLKKSLHAGARTYIGRGKEQWHTEGYATALSVKKALAYAGLKDVSVSVGFYAANFRNVAKSGLIVADHDRLDRYGNRAGEKGAKKAGLPFWLPPDIGDANDYHMDFGLKALSDSLMQFRKSNLKLRDVQ